MTRPVWAVASAGTTARWARALEVAGLAAHPLPWSRIVAAPGAASVPVRLARLRYDLVLLTSPNAPQCLPPGVGDGLPAACVGETTAAAARAAGFRVVEVGRGGGGDLARTIAAGRPPGRVLFLSGRDVRPEATSILEAAGFEVVRVAVYTAEALADFAGRVAAAPEPSATCVGSPRGAEVLREALARTGREAVQGRPCLAAGATTARRLRALGFAPVHEPPVPDAEELARLAAAVLGTGGFSAGAGRR